MSENMKPTPQNDEVDLGQLFKMLGQLFNNIINFIKKIVVGLFKTFIYALKPIVNNIKLITILMFISAVLGYVYEKWEDDVYVSDMIVRPYFDSKYQLVNNISYFNSLIDEGNQKMLTNIFKIDSTESKSLVEFDIKIAPETENDLLKQYDTFLKTLDSTLASTVKFDDFVKNRNILSGSMYKVLVKSKKQDIFPKLEKGISNTFQNTYSQKTKKRRDSSIFIQRRKLERDLKRVDSIQKIYIDVLKIDVEKQTAILPSGGIPLTQEKSNTREYELLQEEIKIRNTLQELDEQLIVESDYFDIVSSFKATGTKESSWTKQYKLLFPILTFIILVLAFLGVKSYNFIKDYE